MTPLVTPNDIRAAAQRIAGRVRVTPTMHAAPSEFDLPFANALTLKLELLQHVGSFKPRVSA